MISFIHLVVASTLTVVAGQILSQEPSLDQDRILATAATASVTASSNTVRYTVGTIGAIQVTRGSRGTVAPDISTAPTAAPATTDCCACTNHPNNSWSNPECCIHGDSANTCADLRWQQQDGSTGSCVWDPAPTADCAPTASPDAGTAHTRRPTASPTTAPTTPCEGSVVLQQADVEEPGFTFSPTSGPGVWFDRCEDSPRCFRRRECNGGGDDTTTAASTPATEPPAQCNTFRAIDMANLPSSPISSGAVLVNYSNTNWGSQTFPVQNTGTSNGCSFFPAGVERGFASHVGHAILTFSQPVNWFYIVTLHQQIGDDITTPTGVVTPQGCVHSSWGQYFKVTLTGPATQVELYDLGTGGGSGVSIMLAECTDPADPSTGATSTSQPPMTAWRAPFGSLWDDCKRPELCRGGDPDLGRRCIKATPCNGSETGSPTVERTRSPTPAPSSQTGGDTRSPNPAPTTAMPTARSPTVAPTAPCEDTITLVPADVEERGMMLVPTMGPGVWFEKCDDLPRCFRERRCNVDRPAVVQATRSRTDSAASNVRAVADVYENITADELQLSPRSRFRYCQRPVRCHGGTDSTGALNRRCLKRLPCNGTGVEETRPPTTAPTAQVIATRAPTPAPTLLTGNTKPPTSAPTAPCEDSVTLIPANTDERGVIYTPTTGLGVWFEQCEGSPRCFRQRRCNGHLVANANRTLISDDQQLPEGSLFRFCQRERQCHGSQHDALDDAVSRRRCIKQVPCIETPTPSPTRDHGRTRSPTATPTRNQDRTRSPTADIVSYETRAPTASPTASCDDTITMVPTEIDEAGFRYEPTSRRGVWFDRCEGSPDCFERKRCSANAGLPASSLFRTCQAEIRCEGQVDDVLRGCQCMKQMPCNDQTNERTRSPTPSPTWKPTPPIIIAGDDRRLQRPIATLVFALDYAAIDKETLATAVLNTLNRAPYSIPSGAIEEVNVHKGSVVLLITLASGTDGSAITSSTDFSVNFDGATVNATSVELCEDCDSSPSSFSASGSNSDDSASSSDGATIVACVLGAALVVAVAVAVAVFAVRQKRNSTKGAAAFDPEMARDPMGGAGEAGQVLYDAAASGDAPAEALYEEPRRGANHDFEPNGFVVEEGRVRIQSVRCTNPTRATENTMYAAADAVGAAGLTESMES